MLTFATRRHLIVTIENIVWRRFADREPHGESVENSFGYRASRDLVSTRALSAIRMVVLDARYLKWIARFSDCSESCGLVGRGLGRVFRHALSRIGSFSSFDIEVSLIPGNYVPIRFFELHVAFLESIFD